MSSSSPSAQRPSAFGAAAFQKAIDVVAHYVDFSDKSSSWSGSHSGDEGTETPDNNEELRTPLLQSQPATPEDSTTTPELDSHMPNDEIEAEADRLPHMHSDQSQNPAQVDVQRQEVDADASSSSNDGAHTPTKEDLRAPLLPSQPVEQEPHTQASTPSPKVAATSGFEKLGSGLLDPSLLQQLLDDHAPPPEMPTSPIRHVEPVIAPPNGHHGMHPPLIHHLLPSDSETLLDLYHLSIAIHHSDLSIAIHHSDCEGLSPHIHLSSIRLLTLLIAALTCPVKA